MLHKENPDYNRNQFDFYMLDQLVPEDHFLRQVDKVIDFDFIYDLVEDTYSLDNGRPSLDPVILVKIPMIQCFYDIRSMRQTIKDIEVNTAYRWFLGLTLVCLNLKKLVKMMAGRSFYFVQMRWFKHKNSHFSLKTLKRQTPKRCLSTF